MKIKEEGEEEEKEKEEEEEEEEEKKKTTKKTHFLRCVNVFLFRLALTSFSFHVLTTQIYFMKDIVFYFRSCCGQVLFSFIFV